MPNEGYRSRKEEWERKERERLLAREAEPYDPKKMRGKIPLGCSLGMIVCLIAILYLGFKILRLALAM